MRSSQNLRTCSRRSSHSDGFGKHSTCCHCIARSEALRGASYRLAAALPRLLYACQAASPLAQLGIAPHSGAASRRATDTQARRGEVRHKLAVVRTSVAPSSASSWASLAASLAAERTLVIALAFPATSLAGHTSFAPLVAACRVASLATALACLADPSVAALACLAAYLATCLVACRVACPVGLDNHKVAFF